MLDLSISNQKMQGLLEQSQVIAVVGESADHYYTSYQVAQYLKDMGYTAHRAFADDLERRPL